MTAGIRPSEFWATTPAEVYDAVDCYFEREGRREQEAWRRAGFIAMYVINMAGKMTKKPVKLEDLVKLEKPKETIDMERRKCEALESLRLHKAKFWTKFKDESVKRILKEGK